MISFRRPSFSSRYYAAVRVLFFTALLALGCTEFDPGSRVTTLRVLAVEADKPYARPGETVHLRALEHDPEARALTWAWAACINPPSQTVQDCLAMVPESESGDGPELLHLGNSTEVDYEVPSDALDALPAAALPLAQVGIVTVACPGSIDFKSSKKTELPLRCIDGDERELGLGGFIVGIKHLRIRASDRNANPTIARLEFDGQPWPETEVKTVSACATENNRFEGCEGKSHELSAVVERASFEEGTSEFGDDFKEQLVVQYYSTEGTFEYEVKIAEEPETRFTARTQSRGLDLLLWFVVRDNRGGVTWTERSVRVR